MANLIEYIQSQVYENSTEDISGSIMQQVLTRMASDEGVLNVHTISGQTPFADYNNAQAARGAVPDGFKKLGLIITYKLSSGWYIDEFIGSATSGWSTASNWKCLGPISVSQNASTGKTTITIGSESFDVATQPVSVSQNTSTGGYNLNIGDSEYNISMQSCTPSKRIKELYLIGDTDGYKNFRFQYLRKFSSGGSDYYQCRICADSISDNTEVEIARIDSDTVFANKLNTILHIKPQNDSNIGGFIILNDSQDVWSSSNDTSFIDTIGAKELSKSTNISSYLDALQQIVITSNPIEKFDSTTIYLQAKTVYFNTLVDSINLSAQSISGTFNHASLGICYNIIDDKWSYLLIESGTTAPVFCIITTIAKIDSMRLSWSLWNEGFNENYRSTDVFWGNAQLSGYTLGYYIANKVAVKGIKVKIHTNSDNLYVYLLDTLNSVTTLIKTFAPSAMSVGVNVLLLDSPIIVGGRYQLVVKGQICYNSIGNTNYVNKVVRVYNDKHYEIFYDTNVYNVFPVYDDNYWHLQDLSNALMNLGNESVDFDNKLKPSLELSAYTTKFGSTNRVVFRYIGYKCNITSIKINAREANADYKIYSLDIENGIATLLKTVTATNVGELTISLDSPFAVTPTTQIGVAGPIGYISVDNGVSYPLYWQGYYYLQTNTIDKISEQGKITVDFGLEYTLTELKSYERNTQNTILNLWGNTIELLQRMEGLEDNVTTINDILENSDLYETVTVKITDYNNNLQSVFDAIEPTSQKHYIVEIPEGTYDVDEWFTREQIENSNVTQWRGLTIPSYVKLLGVGCADKIILQWINNDGTHYDYISTLNTNEWIEMENLTVLARDIRYAVHDDRWNGLDRHIRVKNCTFKVGYHVSRAWGGGCNGGYDGVFENCKFIQTSDVDMGSEYTYVEPFVLHDNYYNTRGNSYLTFKNCRFETPYVSDYTYYYSTSWEQIAYDSNYLQYDSNKSDYAINDCVNMPNDTSHSYKCLYANTQVPPYAKGRPCVNIGFGDSDYQGETPKPVYVTMIGCSCNTYLIVSQTMARATGFGNKFGSGPFLWQESQDSKSVIFDFLE